MTDFAKRVRGQQPAQTQPAQAQAPADAPMPTAPATKPEAAPMPSSATPAQTARQSARKSKPETWMTSSGELKSDRVVPWAQQWLQNQGIDINDENAVRSALAQFGLNPKAAIPWIEPLGGSPKMAPAEPSPEAKATLGQLFPKESVEPISEARREVLVRKIANGDNEIFFKAMLKGGLDRKINRDEIDGLSVEERVEHYKKLL